MCRQPYLLRCCVSRHFYVVVVPLKRTSGTVKNLKNPDEMDMEEVGAAKGKAPFKDYGWSYSFSLCRQTVFTSVLVAFTRQIVLYTLATRHNTQNTDVSAASVMLISPRACRRQNYTVNQTRGHLECWINRFHPWIGFGITCIPCAQCVCAQGCSGNME